MKKPSLKYKIKIFLDWNKQGRQAGILDQYA